MSPEAVAPADRGRRRGLRTLLVALALAGVAVAVLPFALGPGAPEHRRTAHAYGGEVVDCVVRGEQPGPRASTPARSAAVPSTDPREVPRPIDAVPIVDPAEVAGIPLPLRDPALARSGPVVVAIVDSGVDPAVAGVPPHLVLPGADLLNPCGDGRQDVTGHGSSVAAVLVGSSSSVAEQVRILPVRVSTSTGRHAPVTLAAGITYAAARGADVINVSLSRQGGRASLAERAAVRYAASRGAVVVAAAGNNPFLPAGYPAAYPQVLSVTSVTGDGQLSAFSARRGPIDLAAPGSRVIVRRVDGVPEVASGTSLAAPLVSATVVRMLALDPSLHAARVGETLRVARDEHAAGIEVAAAPTEEPERGMPFPSLDARAALLAVCSASPQCVLRDVPAPTAVEAPRLRTHVTFGE